MNDKLKLVLNSRSIIGESPVWDDRNNFLYWIDILDKCVHVFDPDTGGDKRINVGQQIGCLVLCESGNAVVGLEDGIYKLDIKSGELHKFANPEPHLTNNRFNDGKCDPVGRLWIGSMSMAENDGSGSSPPAGSLYCLKPDGKIEKKLDGVTISNGLAWSPDNKTMYYIDSPTRKVVAFDYELSTGEITNGRTVVNIPEDEGIPDGMTIDSEGLLWVAHWGGWKVGRYDPQTGRCVQTVRLPAQNVTCCTFAGKDLEELYITTATIGIDEKDEHQPNAGGVFCVKTGLRGLRTDRFGL